MVGIPAGHQPRGSGGLVTGSRVPQGGKTPLHWSARRGNGAVVGALLEAGADKEAEDKVTGGQGAGRVGGGSVWFVGFLFWFVWN